MKRRTLSLAMVASFLALVFLCGATSGCADGILPSLTETVGISMLSLGEALQRYPDSETENEDGSVTELYINISETDFSTFSVYLEENEAELANFIAENGVLTAEIRVKHASFSLAFDSKAGEVKITYPSGTFDEWVKNAKTRFDAAQQYLAKGKMDEAITEIISIPQFSAYKPVDSLLKEDEKLAIAVAKAVEEDREAKYAPYNIVGNIVTFGMYRQTMESYDPTPIEWIVLDYDKENHKALLLSKFGLDAKPYHFRRDIITWEKCSLREWLNGEFMNNAFNTLEQSAILTINVDNSARSCYIGKYWMEKDVNDTEDQIFLLSYAEANRYLGLTRENTNNKKSRVALTDYAIARGAQESNDYKTADGEPTGFWWLRSHGSSFTNASFVQDSGVLSTIDVDYDVLTVRPALWLDLESGIF